MVSGKNWESSGSVGSGTRSGPPRPNAALSDRARKAALRSASEEKSYSSVNKGPRMIYPQHSWREACADALAEPDPNKLLACLEYAITALEIRCARWDTAPGTTAELSAIRKTILALGRHAEDKLGAARTSRSAEGISDTTKPGVKSEPEHDRR